MFLLMVSFVAQSTKILDDIEKMASTAQIQALEAKVASLEDEKEQLDGRVERAMKMAREAQTAEREMEETLEEFKNEAKNSIPPSPVKVDINALKQQQEDAVNRAKKSVEGRMKLEYDRIISKLKTEHAKEIATTIKKNTHENVHDTKEQEQKKQLHKNLEIQLQAMQHTLLKEIEQRKLLETREAATAQAMIAQEKVMESRLQVARVDADRKRRQVEQCLSLAEERAERAEAEAHNVLVESQLASTLGVKVYELEREREIHLVNIQASRDAIDKMRTQMAEASQNYEKIIKQWENTKAEREQLEIRNVALNSELRSLQRSGNGSGSGSGSGNSNSNSDGNGSQQIFELKRALVDSEQMNKDLKRRVGEEKAKNSAVTSVLQRLVL